MGLKLNGIKINKEVLKNSTDYGAPSMFQQMAMYACTVLVAPLTNTCATAALSGYAVANKARNLILAIYQNSSKANTNFVGQAMGAGKLNKIKEGIKIGWKEGEAKGRKEGRAEGEKIGMEKGERNAMFATARNMKADGMPAEIIAKDTGLTPDEITAL